MQPAKLAEKTHSQWCKRCRHVSANSNVHPTTNLSSLDRVPKAGIEMECGLAMRSNDWHACNSAPDRSIGFQSFAKFMPRKYKQGCDSLVWFVQSLAPQWACFRILHSCFLAAY